MKIIAWIFITIQILMTIGGYYSGMSAEYDVGPIVLLKEFFTKPEVALQLTIEFSIYNLLAIGAIILSRLRKDNRITIVAVLVMITSLPFWY